MIGEHREGEGGRQQVPRNFIRHRVSRREFSAQPIAEVARAPLGRILSFAVDHRRDVRALLHSQLIPQHPSSLTGDDGPQRGLPAIPPSTRGDRSVGTGNRSNVPPGVVQEHLAGDAVVLDVAARAVQDRGTERRVCRSTDRFLRGWLAAQWVVVRHHRAGLQTIGQVGDHDPAHTVAQRCIDFLISRNQASSLGEQWRSNLPLFDFAEPFCSRGGCRTGTRGARLKPN